MKWSFNRLRDSLKIEKEVIKWNGPYAWPKFEIENGLKPIPDVEGVYLFTFKFKDGFLIYGAGITNSTKRRISQHNNEFKKGNYTIFNIESAEQGERDEIWHGWSYAKTHKSEFEENQELILRALNKQFSATRIFIAEINDKRKRERFEAAIMYNIYTSNEPWSELADRGMFLKERLNSEMPVETLNRSSYKIYGLPEKLEI